MVALAECFAPEKPAAEPKTRVWDFLGPDADRVGESALQVVDRDWEITLVIYDSRRSASLARSGQIGGSANDRSKLGNFFRKIPVLGGVLGGVGDVASGVGSFATGRGSVGLSQIGRGLKGIGYGSLDIAGKAWASPYTALGVAWGLAGVPFGAKITFGNNAIQFENHPFMSGAITFGNSISYSSSLGPSRDNSYYGRTTNVGDHEEGHTYQYQLFGPLYPLFYFPRGLANPGNPLEQGADDHATGGSWFRIPIFGSGNPHKH